MGNFIVEGILLAIVVLVVVRLVKNKKAGKNQCVAGGR